MPTDISERIFGKSIYNIAETDLLKFFAIQQPETSISEFKSYKQGTDEDANLNKISETLCAFLNSEGGLLIWGSPVGVKSQEGKHKVFVGPLTPLPNLLDKDAIIRKVSAKISPLSPNIKFQSVNVAGRYCYIFEVSKSEYAPHQIDGRYLMRLDGSNIPAPHYYVEALMKRISFPKLSGKVAFCKMFWGNKYLAIPVIVYISNQSPYTPEKNLYYDIVATNCKIVKPNEHQMDFDYKERNTANGEMKISHFSAPLHHRYFLLFNRSSESMNDLVASIMLTFSGDTSPINTSSYKLTIHSFRQDPYYSYEIEIEKESQSVIDHIAQLGKTDAQRESESVDLLSKIFDRNGHTFMVHNYVVSG